MTRTYTVGAVSIEDSGEEFPPGGSGHPIGYFRNWRSSIAIRTPGLAESWGHPTLVIHDAGDVELLQAYLATGEVVAFVDPDGPGPVDVQVYKFERSLPEGLYQLTLTTPGRNVGTGIPSGFELEAFQFSAFQ